MKKLTFLFFTIFAAFVSAQLPKGLTVSASGVTIGEYYYTVNMKKAPEAVTYYGNQLSIRMAKVSGFKAVNGKVQLKTLLRIKDKTGKIILENDDVFKADNENGGLDAEKVAASLDLLITVASPMKLKETYTAEFAVTDKNGKGQVKGSFNFSSRLIPTALYGENGITSDGPVFITMPGNKVVKTKTLDNPQTLYAMFYNVKGLTAVNSKVFLEGSVTVKDSKGRTILSFTDLYKNENESGGVHENDAKERLMLSFTFKEDAQPGEEYTCIFTIADKKKKNNYLSATVTVVWNK